MLTAKLKVEKIFGPDHGSQDITLAVVDPGNMAFTGKLTLATAVGSMHGFKVGDEVDLELTGPAEEV